MERVGSVELSLAGGTLTDCTGVARKQSRPSVSAAASRNFFGSADCVLK